MSKSAELKTKPEPINVSQFERKRDKCAIVGYAPNRHQTPFEDDDFDIVGMNDLHIPENWPMDIRHKVRWDVWFDMHHPSVMRSFSRGKEAHWEWLKRAKIPVYTLGPIKEIPASVAYPLTEIVTAYGSQYFTSTVAYQLAWALHAGYKEVHVYGVNFIGREEYEYQRACTEYWIGYLRGKGVTVYLPDTSCLLQSAYLYGYETHQLNKNVVDNLNAQLASKVEEINAARDKILRQAYQHDGQIDALKWFIDVFSHIGRGGYLPPPDNQRPTNAYQQQSEERKVKAVETFKKLAADALSGDPYALKKLEAGAAVLLGLPDDIDQIHGLEEQ